MLQRRTTGPFPRGCMSPRCAPTPAAWCPTWSIPAQDLLPLGVPRRRSARDHGQRLGHRQLSGRPRREIARGRLTLRPQSHRPPGGAPPPMSQLFSPIRLRDLEIRNRVWVSPMCQYSSRPRCADDWHVVHLGSSRGGGAGLVFTEATAVTPAGRITPRRHRHLERRAAGALGADRRLRARARGARRDPARARRPQGLDRAPVASARGAVADERRRLAAVGAVGRAVHAATPDPRASTRTDRRRRRRVRRGRAARRSRPVRRPRDPRRARLSAARVPLPADRTAATTSTAARSRTAPASSSTWSRGARRSAGRDAARPAHLGDRLGRGRLDLDDSVRLAACSGAGR